MKQRPKIYENVSRDPSKKFISGIGSSLGSVDELVLRFRSFYKEAYLILFDLIVKQVWLEQKFLYNGVRRKRSMNGYGLDWIYSYFMKSVVGISQKPLTTCFIFTVVPTYFNDFFPNFSDHDPFEEPEYFKYPYKNVSLDHLLFVYQHHERLEMLAEAEKRSMNIKDFTDWAANQGLSCRDEKGEEMYSIVRYSFLPYFKKIKK